MIKIIQRRKIWFLISGVLIATSIFALSTWGLKLGIDFTGGSLLEVEFTGYRPSISEIQDSLSQANLHNIIIQPTDNTIIIRFQENNETAHQAAISGLTTLIKDKDGASVKELQFDAVGPSIGQELKRKSFNAGFIVLVLIIVYISFSFRKVSQPMASWKYGVAAIIALAHDLMITCGVFSFLGHFYGMEINTSFIAAILTVLGYSVNDTIIVFDRIRENLPKSREDFENTVNRSLNQTLIRSFNTSLSSILALLAVVIFGGDSIRGFSLALLVGVFIGTYSSLFVASPILVIWDNFSRRSRS